jgi:LTXXQ motif family protein
MKILGKVLGVALASLIALPGAQARPRFGGLLMAPLAIVGGIAGAAVGSRKARAFRSYARHNVRRERAIRQARPAAAPGLETAAAIPAPEQHRTTTASQRGTSGGWSGPLFWPYAYDGVFEYAFGLPGDDKQFWARGFGDVIDGMFVQTVRETTGRASNDGLRTWGNLCGSEAQAAPHVTVARIREAVQPTAEQQPAIEELRQALARAAERIGNACPASQAETPPERLHMMAARLTAVRQAVLTVQGPLRTFYEQLNDKQKEALERLGSDHDTASNNPNAGCAAPVANWPQAQIERAVRPTNEQRAYLERLRQTSLGLAQFVASTCPANAPRTAPERLEAVKERLGALRYAASNVSPAYEQFYASLTDAQKVRFRSISRERRADR